MEDEWWGKELGEGGTRQLLQPRGSEKEEGKGRQKGRGLFLLKHKEETRAEIIAKLRKVNTRLKV